MKCTPDADVSRMSSILCMSITLVIISRDKSVVEQGLDPDQLTEQFNDQGLLLHPGEVQRVGSGTGW